MVGRGRRLLRSLGTVVPILDAGDVRHPVVMAIPSLEAIDAEEPEARAHVGEHNEPVVIPNVDAERPLLDARRALPSIVRRAAEAMLVLALARVPVAHRFRILRVGEIEDLQSVLVGRDEYVGPANLVIVGEIAPVRGPGADWKIDVLRLPALPRLEIPDAERRILILRLGHCITTIRR